jgi:hypothetical protein
MESRRIWLIAAMWLMWFIRRFKQSGVGKDPSAFGLEDYTRIKHAMSSRAS